MEYPLNAANAIWFVADLKFCHLLLKNYYQMIIRLWSYNEFAETKPLQDLEIPSFVLQ